MIYILVWIAIFAVVELILFYIYSESIGFKTTQYRLVVNKYLPRKINIVMLSDLHDTDLGSDNDELIKAINDIAPDFVLLAGDMITSYMQPEYNSDITFRFLKKLVAGNKVYYGLGNHEQRYLSEPDKFPGKYKELKDYVTGLGIEFLENSCVRLDEYNCSIYGLNVPIEYYRRVVTKKLPDDFVARTLGENDKSRLNILIAHNPDQFDIYEKWHPDVIVSGHVHGGIVGIPKLGGLISPQLKLFPKYDFGVFEKGITKMVLGRGIGWHTLPVRINNKAEIVNIIIEGEEERTGE